MNVISDDNIQLSPPLKDNPNSIGLNGPHEPLCDESTLRPSLKSDKGKGKMPEYEVEVHLDDSNSDDSALSLDSEFGVPIMRTPGVKKALTTTKEGAHSAAHHK